MCYSSSRCYGPDECDAHDSNQTQCELTQGCNYNPSRCYTAGYYELWTVLDACGADISDADADNLAREEGYWGGMDHLIGLVQGAPAPPSPSSSGGSGGGTSSLLEGYCAGWEMSLVCDGRLQELGETNCTNLGCDWDSDANACSPPNGGDATVVHHLCLDDESAESDSIPRPKLLLGGSLRTTRLL